MPPPNNDSWIRPTKVTYDNLELTVRGSAWLMGDPLHWENPSACLLDPYDQSNYVTEIDIFEVVNNPNGSTFDTAPAVLITPPSACNCCENFSLACGGVRDGKTGLAYVGLELCDLKTGAYGNYSCNACNHIEKVTIRYQAGVKADNACGGNWLNIVARLTAGLLPEICSNCTFEDSFFLKWSRDLSEASTEESVWGRRFKTPVNLLENPFGTTEGSVYAWQEIQNLHVGNGVMF